MASKFDLSLVIKAVDRATAPLRAINKQINKTTAPFRKLNNSMRAMASELGLPRVAKSFGNIGREVVGLGKKIGWLVFGGGGAGYAMYRLTRGAVDAGDKLAEMAQRTGLGVDAYAQLQFAASQADIDQEQFNSSLDQFNRRLGELKEGTGPLKALGKVFGEQLKGAGGTDGALTLAVKAMQKLKDPAKQAALASVLFGKSGLQMGQWLASGSEEIDKQRKRYLELAGSQAEFAKQAGLVDNAMRESGVALEGVRNTVFTAFAPALIEGAKAIANLIGKNKGNIAKWAQETGRALLEWVKGGGLDRLVTGIGDLAKNIGRAVDAIGGLKVAAVGVAAVMGSSLIGAVLKAGWVVGGVLVEGLVAAWPLLKAVGAAIAGFGAGAIAAVTAAIAALGIAAFEVYKNFEPLKELFTDLFGDGGLFATAWEAMKNPLALLDPRTLINDVFGTKFGIETGNAQLPAAIPPGGKNSEAHVTLDINGLPKGSRVSTDPRSTAPIDLSLGYSMAEAH